MYEECVISSQPRRPSSKPLTGGFFSEHPTEPSQTDSPDCNQKLRVVLRMRSRLDSMFWKVAELSGTTAELQAEEAKGKLLMIRSYNNG
jgi:hypothetical protein